MEMEQAIAEYVSLRHYETTEMNLERRRVFFLILNRTGNMDEAITFANININMKYLRCKYKFELTEKLKEYLTSQ
jgi:hypothetical protein